MKQTKKQSLIEACINTFVGYVITLAFSPLVYWLCDVPMKYSQMSMVVLLFTILSVIRSYVIRRFFNGWSNVTNKNSKPLGWYYHKWYAEYYWARDNHKQYYVHINAMCDKYKHNLYGEPI